VAGNTTSETGYYGRVSDMNWSPVERVLYNIPLDPQVGSKGMSSVHIRPHTTAQEFLGITDNDLSSSAPEVFLPLTNTMGL